MNTHQLDGYTLDDDAARDLERRTDLGNEILATVWNATPEGDDDREAAASDAISAVLTALIGPAGIYVYGHPHAESRPEAMPIPANQQDAYDLLARALESWRGDMEDYCATRDEATT